MESESLKLLKTQIGKNFSNSPSPFSRWLHGKLTDAEKGSVTCEFEVREDMTNPIGTLHGGVMAGIIDDLIGVTMFTLGDKFFHVSVNLVVDFLSNVRKGDTIIAKTYLVKQGNTLSNAGCDLYDKKGKLLAKGYSNLMKSNTEI